MSPRSASVTSLCSAAEETEELTGSDAPDDERTRLGEARHRCPYGTPATDAIIKRCPAENITATLHCERRWVEANS